MFKRLVTTTLVLAAMAASTIALAQNDDAGGRADLIRIAIKGSENNITPFTLTFGSNPATNDVIHLVYDSLFWSQVKSDPDPWLAESAESNDDGSEWTVTLRDGVEWHDGTPFTADDVRFSLEYYLANGGSAGRYAHHISDTPDFDRAEIIDPLTIKLFFNQPTPQFKIMPGADLPIIPKHIWEGIEDPSAAGDMIPIGTGPFKVEAIDPDQSYRLVANENYFLGRPTVDRLDLIIIPDPAAAFSALQAGTVDMVERNVPPELLEQFRSSDEIEVVEGTRIESNQLYFNALKPPLDDPELRRAIAMSFDLESVVDTVLLGNARPGRDTFLHPESFWAVDDNSHDFDVDAANQILDDAGYLAPSEGELRQTPDGAALSFNVLVNSFEPLDIRAVQLLAEQTAAIGVELTPEPLEPTALRAARRPPEGELPTYDAYVSGLESHAHVDPDALYYFFHSPGTKGFGGAITGFTNTEFDRIAEAAAHAPEGERRNLVGELQQILIDERPAQVLWYPDGIWAYRPEAYQGWVSDPGHGIFTVRSFLPGTANVGSGEDASSTDSTPPDTVADAEADTVVDDESSDAPAVEDESVVDDDDGSNTGALILLVLLAVAAIGAGIFLVKRRKSPDETADTDY